MIDPLLIHLMLINQNKIRLCKKINNIL